MKLFCALLMISIFPLSGTMALPEDSQSFRGRIIATRQMEGFEFITFVDNREYFLFRTKDNSHDVIKIVRTYRGHNGLSGDYLEGLPLLRIKAVRYAGCDETYSSFIDEANKHKKESLNGESVNSSEEGGVLSFGKPKYYLNEKEVGLPKDYPLKCYVTGQNDFEFLEEP
jgi:hypothetical protein